MCRNIKMLHNFKPPATEEEIRASSLQFVRKLSGFNKPSKANEEVFNRAVDQVAQAARDARDSETCMEAIRTLARLGGNRSASLLDSLLPSLEPHERLLIVRARPARHAPHSVTDFARLPIRFSESSIIRHTT